MNTENMVSYLEGLWVNPLYQLTFKNTPEGISGELVGPPPFREILEIDPQFQVLKIHKADQSEQIFYRSKFLTFVDPASTHWHQIRFLTLEDLSIVATNSSGKEVAILDFKRSL
ncbi:MAG: hypothetical protein WCI18_01770 [Pseudomonadota bacterium]